MNKKTKFIFVTGGVISGLGKGISAASIGRLLKARGFKIFALKFDPYYNVDPGTMSPYQHGEVFVTKDGGETDLDLGHYERFIGEKLTKESNYVQGKLLLELLEEERKGKYNGNTIQVIPHVTNKIIDKIKKVGEKSQADFVIIEIGGTVGDIESQSFISAISQFSRKFKDSSFFIHTTFLPYLETSKEFKSKPTQNSLIKLQASGIFPDLVLLRANRKIHPEIVKKVEHKAYIEEGHCIPVPNADNVYKIPLYLESYEVAQKILKKFNIKDRKANLDKWKEYVQLIEETKVKTITIGLIGKYIEFEDAYISILEALKISGNWNKVNIDIKWIQSEGITSENINEKLSNLDGIIILPGFGPRGFEGKVKSAWFAREKNIPTLGICYGMQAMVVAQARHLGIKDANSSEVTSKGTHVIDIIRGKNKDDNIGGTLRLGASTTVLKKDSLSSKLYQSDVAIERHRHRYEVNPLYVNKLETKEFKFTGFDEKTKLAEVCEVIEHNFYIGTQAHPEFNANPLKEHPLFRGFIKAIIKNKK